jgi:tetratricopeptide (TPR) repeat protein
MNFLSAMLIGCLSLGFCVAAHSQSKSLTTLVQELQQSPLDRALREKVIKLALASKPIPAIPEEARRPFVRGNTVMADAKSADDYARAAQLYLEALTVAPWWGDAYFNLAKARELQQEFANATDALNFYLMTVPPANEARKVQDRIYALEEKRDSRNKSLEIQRQAEAAKNQRKEWANSIASQINARFAGRSFWSHLCVVGTSMRTSEEQAKGSCWRRGRDLRTAATSATVGGESDDIVLMPSYLSSSPVYCAIPKGPGLSDLGWGFCKDGKFENFRAGESIDLDATWNGNPAIGTVSYCEQRPFCQRNYYEFIK